MKRARAPGAALLHPLALTSLLVLVLNDHVLKRAYPGFLTGKLSDFAGVLLLPLFMHALFELAHVRFRGRRACSRTANRVLAASISATVIGFALPEIWAPADAAYRWGLGVLQWPFRTPIALLQGEALPALRAVRATADPGDLFALPMALVAFVVARQGCDSGRHARHSDKALLVLLSMLVTTTFAFPASAANKAGEHTHDGFYLGFEIGAGVAFIDSTASISNDFLQDIPSSATGVAGPAGALELGGTLAGLGLVLGGRIGLAQVTEPVIETLGERFTIEGSRFKIFDFQLLAEWYPNTAEGLHFGGSLGGMSLERGDASGDLQRGFCASVEAGHGVWIARQWTLGGVARLTVARLAGDEHGTTTLVMPGAFAAIAWH